jgi:hypothetical protein
VRLGHTRDWRQRTPNCALCGILPKARDMPSIGWVTEGNGLRYAFPRPPMGG